jgi:uncharacterized protein YndB with AHSA1/START domain
MPQSGDTNSGDTNSGDTNGVNDSTRVEHEIELDAPLDEVWTALTDPTQLGEWLGGTVELEVRPAASGHVIGDDGTHYAVLVTDVDANRRVAWHWWDDAGVLSSVEMTIEPAGEAVRLRVVETLVVPDPTGTRASACSRRWERATGRLWQRVAAHAACW